MTLLDVDRRTLRLFVLPDLVAILAFVFVGELQHGMLGFDAARPLRFLAVAAPFLIGWAIAGPVLGAYGASARTARGLLGWSVLAWVGADVLAQVLLATGAFPEVVDPIFFVVAGVFGGVFLLVARGIAWFVVEA